MPRPDQIPWDTTVRQHPGSTLEETANEPDWGGGHQNRIGYRNRQDRVPGLTHSAEDDEDNTPDLTSSSSAPSSEDKREFTKDAREEYDHLRQAARKGELLNFRDIINDQEDFHLRYQENRSPGWRYVLEVTEDWVKNKEEWPANVKRRKKEEKEKEQEEEEKERKGHDQKDAEKSGNRQEKNGDARSKDSNDQEEHDWKRSQGDDSKHNNAYAAHGEASADEDEKEKSEYAKLLERYSPQEIALLRALKHEKTYRTSLQMNDGKRKSPQTKNRRTVSIDEQDQFTPDNWLPRSEDLIRLTGKHPLNAEADLTKLFNGGLITPNELHYVRNHGSVPRLLWELHKLDVENGKLVLTMDDLTHKFETVNIPVTLACDGNRRKELNMIKKSKGFNWGSGATGCVYWRGPLLRDLLLTAGVTPGKYTGEGKLRWVNFEGADEPSEGKYQTCIPLHYAMDPTNDVIVAFEMNDVPLPPDHGYPCRLLIPGFVGGRCVKWLSRIWITDFENTSHYHIWDNRVLPSFVTEKDGEFAQTMFSHPDTACNEQNLNSVIVRPAQGERIPLSEARNGKTYRVSGYAYDGGGHEVQRVEVSLDGGETWLYCIRKFPDYPIRHGRKFWTWLHWHVDVSVIHLLQAKKISVRAWNVFKNTQPERAIWNTMGMMNNCWYTVKPEIEQQQDDDIPHILFRHPTEPGTGEGGWMKPSVENQVASAKQSAGAPQKQFTRQEIEKHNREDDCWLVINGQVYDATSVISWHPGGKAAIVGHGGKVHQATSDEFASIHDDYAYKKLQGCALGAVTDKAAQFIKAEAEAAAKEKMQSKKNRDGDVVLQKHRWVPVKLTDRQDLSKDTRKYTFALPDGMKDLGLGTCQHIQLGFHLKDKMLIRSYTPTSPLLPDPKKAKDRMQSATSRRATQIKEAQDGNGSFELVVKIYFPTDEQPGGAMSNILDCLPLHEEIEIRGPTGEIVYNGNGSFVIEDKEHKFKKISLVVGGSGLTPAFALIARALMDPKEDVQLRVVDANKSEKDILLREELDSFEKDSKGLLKITHVLSHPSDEWKGKKGHVNADIIKETLFPPKKGSAVFLCGPPAMIQKAALPALTDWGYEEDKNCFGF